MSDARSPPKSRLSQFLFVVCVIGAWWLATKTKAISPLFLPSPDSVWVDLVGLIGTKAFYEATSTTLSTVLEAYALAVFAGLSGGYILTRSRFMTEVFEPILAGIFAIPITLFFPLFVLFFGIGPQSKIAYGATYGFFPILLTTIAALSSVDDHYLTAARSAGFTAWGTLRHVLAPSAFPVVMSGLRLGFFICFASVLGGETITSKVGVGKSIALDAELMEPAKMYAWIVIVVFTTWTLNSIASILERRARNWSEVQPWEV